MFFKKKNIKEENKIINIKLYVNLSIYFLDGTVETFKHIKQYKSLFKEFYHFLWWYYNKENSKNYSFIYDKGILIMQREQIKRIKVCYEEKYD